MDSFCYPGNKAALRKEMLSLRNAALCASITIKELKAIPEFIKAKTIFCYVSAKGEVETKNLISELLKEKTVVVPYCTDREGNMICVKIASPDDLKEGMFGIPEPKIPIEFPKEHIDFAIVPGVAFDKSGYRIGYGKGYYDRFLKDINPFKVGVCQKQFFLDSVPHDEFDVKMDSVLVL